ncbi:MAG: tetratricopeptide repeat protein [Synergistaceae bacterium]|jgi:hypothetical protein|nr:tetratricopeptide repeat protein [Synergistaceae bacterium]
MKNRVQTAFVGIFVFLCAFFLAFVMEAEANGNVSADEAPTPVRPDANRSARKAPVRRPPKKTTPRKSATRKTARPSPRKVSSLERGIALMEQKRYEEARSWLRKAVGEERKNPYAWYWYGLAHDKVGQFQQAQLFYTRAAALDPSFPPFSRIMLHPDEGGRIPLWDPLRRARLYGIETNHRGMEIVPPGSSEATRRPMYPDPPLTPGTLYPPYPPARPSQPARHAPPVYIPPLPPGEETSELQVPLSSRP